MESFASLVVLPCLILGVLFGACDSISSNEGMHFSFVPQSLAFLDLVSLYAFAL